MDTPTSDSRYSERGRSWGLIAASAGFLLAAAAIITIGIVSLGIDPTLH